MSCWVKKDDGRTWAQKWCTAVLTKGPVPRHVGFILDGNRRYARGKNLQTVEGHRKGFDKLSETLRWCSDLGIHEVTVYVFSIENFKRSAEEVAGLMKLAKEKFQNLLEEEESLMKEGICIQIVGDWSLVPSDLRPMMAKAMTMTRHNTRAKLNVAFAYTSRNEMTRGMRHMHEGLRAGELLPEDITCELLEESFYLLPSEPLDLLVRTSGETRLSDFLLWQSTETVLCFSNVLWPDFTYWHLLSVIFQYQVDKINLLSLNMNSKRPSTPLDSEERKSKFIAKIREEQWKVLREEADQTLSSIPSL